MFRNFANKISKIFGSPYAFLGALIIVGVWASSGPVFGFSDTWQLVINTGTTIVTFLMVFLIQNTQNRDSKAMQLKLDELIRATKARDAFVDLEDLSDEELTQLDKEFQTIHQKQIAGPVLKKLHKSIEIENELRKAGDRHSVEKLNHIINIITAKHDG
jgi:low affinity Fe/Cu permease